MSGSNVERAGAGEVPTDDVGLADDFQRKYGGVGVYYRGDIPGCPPDGRTVFKVIDDLLNGRGFSMPADYNRFD